MAGQNFSRQSALLCPQLQQGRKRRFQKFDAYWRRIKWSRQKGRQMEMSFQKPNRQQGWVYYDNRNYMWIKTLNGDTINHCVSFSIPSCYQVDKLHTYLSDCDHCILLSKFRDNSHFLVIWNNKVSERTRKSLNEAQYIRTRGSKKSRVGSGKKTAATCR